MIILLTGRALGIPGWVSWSPREGPGDPRALGDPLAPPGDPWEGPWGPWAAPLQGASWGSGPPGRPLAPSWAALGALLRAPKSRLGEKREIVDSTTFFVLFGPSRGPSGAWRALGRSGASLGPSGVLFGGYWVASTGDVVRSGDGTQRNSAEISAPQRGS